MIRLECQKDHSGRGSGKWTLITLGSGRPGGSVLLLTQKEVIVASAGVEALGWTEVSAFKIRSIPATDGLTSYPCFRAAEFPE